MRHPLAHAGALAALSLLVTPAWAQTGSRNVTEDGRPAGRVAAAAAAARVQPSGESWLNGAQIYAYEDGALFQVYASPGHVTDIALQPGEALSDQGAVAAGDTVRWIIGQSQSGAGETRRWF